MYSRREMSTVSTRSLPVAIVEPEEEKALKSKEPSKDDASSSVCTQGNFLYKETYISLNKSMNMSRLRPPTIKMFYEFKHTKEDSARNRMLSKKKLGIMKPAAKVPDEKSRLKGSETTPATKEPEEENKYQLQLMESQTTSSAEVSDKNNRLKGSETTTATKEPEEENSSKYQLQLMESQTTSSAEVSDKNKLKVLWSLEEEIVKLFNHAMRYVLPPRQEGVSCSISPCPIQDGDYLCTSILELWPKLREERSFGGPISAGLNFRKYITCLDTTGMIERCVVFGPGVLMFKLSMKWIAKSIHKMVKAGIGACALNRSVERAILYFYWGDIKMHMDPLRSAVIGETLARILEYSGVDVIRRFHEEDYELNLKTVRYGIVNNPPSHFLWVSDKSHRIAVQKIYERLGVHVKEEVSCFDPFDPNIIETLRDFKSEGDEAIYMDLAALWHALNVVKADWILHVTDVGQQDHFEMCISAAKRAGWIANDGCPYPLSHVGFGLVETDEYERLGTRSTTVVNLLDEAKIRCKAVLEGQGKADEWTAEELEHTAEALGYGAVKYAVLKSNRLTKCRLNFDEMLNEKGNTVVYLHYTHAQVCSVTTEYRKNIKDLKRKKLEELTLKNNEERELGLHLLRFTEVLGEVCTVLMPHILCEYLYALCNKFDSFYSCVCQVVGYSDHNSKLLLCEATEMVMRKCFHLLGIIPIHKKIRLKLRPHSERLYFSDLTEQQLMELFCKGPCFRFDLCGVVLRHDIDASVKVLNGYKQLRLYGIIQAETHISDPSHCGSFNIFNRNLDDPLVITKSAGSLLSPHDICYCSLSVSTFVKITAKLYGTNYMGGELDSRSDYRKYMDFLKYGVVPRIEVPMTKFFNDNAIDVCNGSVFITFSEYFANRPNGGSGSCELKGKDGCLDLYYVALKYAVEAALEVGFVATCKKTKVFGSVMAYYGKNFCYDCDASESSPYTAMLFEIEKPSHIEPGCKINLTRSTLGVPAQYSLIIRAKLHDFTSGDMILSGICEFFVPVDGSSSIGFIMGSDCSLKVKVDWKLPIHVKG